MYHQVDVPPPSGTPARGMVVSPGAFARQMALLAAFGWRTIGLAELGRALAGRGAAPRTLAITFDDGYRNNLEHALPVLQRHRFTATCYAVSSLFGSTNRWDEGKGVPRKQLMDGSDWRAWLAGGMEVGAHGRRHLDLRTLDGAAARDEIAGSRRELEDSLGVPIRHFCYPYGSFDPRDRDLVREAGFATATTVERGRAAPGADLLALPRVLIAQSTHLGHFLLKLATGYEDRRTKAPR